MYKIYYLNKADFDVEIVDFFLYNINKKLVSFN